MDHSETWWFPVIKCRKLHTHVAHVKLENLRSVCELVVLWQVSFLAWTVHHGYGGYYLWSSWVKGT